MRPTDHGCGRRRACRCPVLLWTTALVLALPGPVLAHGLSGECTVRSGRLVVEAYFDTGEPAADALVRLLDQNDQEVAFGRTDRGGAWSCPRPAPGAYSVHVDAGSGHRVKLSVQLTDAVDSPSRVDSGPSRSTFTGEKLGKIAGGLLIIAVIAVAARLVLRRRADARANTL